MILGLVHGLVFCYGLGPGHWSGLGPVTGSGPSFRTCSN